MENTVLTQTDKSLDHASLLLASLIVKDVHRLIRGIHAIVSVLVRYATIAVSITNWLRGSILPATALEHRKYAQRIEVSLQGISIAKLPLAG
jgi:hypothetical protein